MNGAEHDSRLFKAIQGGFFYFAQLCVHWGIEDEDENENEEERAEKGGNLNQTGQDLVYRVMPGYASQKNGRQNPQATPANSSLLQDESFEK